MTDTGSIHDLTETLTPEQSIMLLSDACKEYRAHLNHAHLTVDRLRKELRTLNEVILRRKEATRRMQTRLDVAKALHSPKETMHGDLYCGTCLNGDWPCDTYIALQPSVVIKAANDF